MQINTLSLLLLQIKVVFFFDYTTVFSHSISTDTRFIAAVFFCDIGRESFSLSSVFLYNFIFSYVRKSLIFFPSR